MRSSILLSGARGVGKTVSIRTAINILRSEQSRGFVPSFKVCFLNGMEILDPFQAYVELWEAISGPEHAGSDVQAQTKLEEHFKRPDPIASNDDPSITIVVSEEIDKLVDEHQSALFNLFEWPIRAARGPGGRSLVILVVSNIHMFARQLKPRIRSRLGSEEIVFLWYRAEDIMKILKAQISKVSLVSPQQSNRKPVWLRT